MSFDFDLFVIGGGSGGVRAARIASSEVGVRVGLAEEDRYGGTCVIRGCVPKKLMVFASEVSHALPEARAFGWEINECRFDWVRFHGTLNEELNRLEGVYRSLLEKAGVTTFDQRAKVIGPHTIELANGETKTAQFILIAVGGVPDFPNIEGIEYSLSSNDMFHFKALPKSILIVGGGYIACEFSGIMNGLGVQTTQYYRGAQILRGFDDEARGIVADEMRKRGVDLQCGVNVCKIEKTNSGVLITDTKNEKIEFDAIMFATGRIPKTMDLFSKNLSLELGNKGEIIVDNYSQTRIPSIFAVGDVTNRVNLTPVAIHEAMAFVETVFRGHPSQVDHDLIPTAIFTQPEMGTVGLSEENAAALGPIEVFVANFRAMRHSFVGKGDKSFIKLVICAKSRKLQGCQIIAPQASELIQLLGIAIKMGATKEDLDNTMAVHPTIAEELVTMRSPTRKT